MNRAIQGKKKTKAKEKEGKYRIKEETKKKRNNRYSFMKFGQNK